MKNIIIGVAIGIALAVVGYCAYVVVKMQTQLNANTNTIVQIVDFLNKATATSTQQ
jgi:flagellar biogenesis protein FliO